MGAVNYSRSDYITMCLKPYDPESFSDENGNIDCEEMESCYESDRENADFIIKKYDFCYFHVATKPGYYEGFSVDIEYNFPVAFDNWEEKRDAQKEVTQIKKMLLECAGVGLVKCVPGWCTSYSDYAGTCKAISTAVAEMREEVKRTPTWAQYERETA